jgi:hypothetical protein
MHRAQWEPTFVANHDGPDWWVRVRISDGRRDRCAAAVSHVTGCMLGVALIVSLLPRNTAAQVRPETRLANLAVNGAIGGGLAAVRAALQRRAPLPATARGALGGIVMSVGKQVASARFDGAGLAGRQIHALGLSAVASASGDTATVLLIPPGPLVLEFRPGARRAWRTRVDVVESVILLLAATAPHSRFDWRESLSTGAPVFMWPRERMSFLVNQAGLAAEGVIILAADAGQKRRLFLAHERVHVLQWDAYRHLITLPLERATLRGIFGRRAPSHVDLGVLAPASVYALTEWIHHEDQPWEREAFLLTAGCICIPVADGGLAPLTRSLARGSRGAPGGTASPRPQ